ncbi:MAG: ubiquitin-like domain-containing protein [Mycobacteriales bacterium]
MVGAATAWAATEKKITLVVDGQPQVQRTHARTVEGALNRAGLKVGSHDVLAPDAAAGLENGSRVVLNRARQVNLTFEGRPRHIWVTARSVDELLGQVGLRQTGVYVSASRSRRIPLKGMSLELRLPKQATVLVDGRAPAVTTTVATVGDLLEQDHVKLGATDKSSVPLSTQLHDGIVVSVTRLRMSTATVTAQVAPPVIRKPDSSMFSNQSKVLVAGSPGIAIQTWRYTITNGKVTAKKLLKSVTTRAAKTQVLAVGTKAVPVPSTSASGLNWAALANCESGGNPRAVNPAGYYGLYQFSMGTWRSVGGSGNPADASSGEQTYRAQLLYNRSGAGNWPNCGRYLYT